MQFILFLLFCGFLFGGLLTIIDMLLAYDLEKQFYNIRPTLSRKIFKYNVPFKELINHCYEIEHATILEQMNGNKLIIFKPIPPYSLGQSKTIRTPCPLLSSMELISNSDSTSVVIYGKPPFFSSLALVCGLLLQIASVVNGSGSLINILLGIICTLAVIITIYIIEKKRFIDHISLIEKHYKKHGIFHCN